MKEEKLNDQNIEQVLLGYKLRDQVEDYVFEAGGWEAVAGPSYYGSRLNSTVKVAEVHLDEGEPDGYGGWGESAHAQGHEGTCFVVLEYQGRFFRMTGTTDSYANRSWDGKFREVKRGEVQVVKYEWSAA